MRRDKSCSGRSATRPSRAGKCVVSTLLPAVRPASSKLARFPDTGPRMSCRTRFAPSPTGYLHIGGARTALYCWLEARRRGGQFILRVEDTDRERSTQAAIDAILKAMDWLGLDYDEGPIYQTDRLDRYRQVAEQLVAAGTAYYAY